MAISGWTLGEARITRITETDASEPIQSTIPDATTTAVRGIDWLYPSYCNTNGTLKAVVQSFLISIRGIRILVDTCVGNDKPRTDLPGWHALQTPFLEQLSIQGFTRHSVDIILNTHFHFDHIGWNTMLIDNKWIPTFPQARYIFSKAEYEYWRRVPKREIDDDHVGFADSIVPVVDAGLATFVSDEFEVIDGVRLVPTPGHTPHHVSVMIESNGHRGIITGDAIHHPCQIARPDWVATSDSDSALAYQSRIALLDRVADSDTLLLGSHFADHPAGRVRRCNSYFRFVEQHAGNLDFTTT